MVLLLCALVLGLTGLSKAQTMLKVDILVSDDTVTHHDLERVQTVLSQTASSLDVVANLHYKYLEDDVPIEIQLAQHVSGELVLLVTKCQASPVPPHISFPAIPVPLPCQTSDNPLHHQGFVAWWDWGSVLADIINHLKWNKFIIAYEKSTGLLADQVTLRTTSANRTVQYIRLPENLDVKGLLSYVIQRSDAGLPESHILLLCSPNCTRHVLQQMHQYGEAGERQGMVEYNTRWIVLGDTSMLKQLLDYTANISNVMVVSAIHRSWTHVDRELSALFTRFTIAFINGSSNAGDTNARMCHQSDRRMTSRNKCYKSLSSLRQNRISFEIFSTSSADGGHVRLGEWSGGRISAGTTVEFRNSHCGFCGKHLMVGTNPWPRFVEKYTNKSAVVYTGFCIEILNQLGKTLHFSYTLVEPTDGQWGSDINGSWTGLVGMLQRKEVDMVISALSFHTHRDTVMDFSEEFYIEYNTVLVALVNPATRKWQLFTQPFRWQVWLCILLAMALVALVAWWITRVSPFYAWAGKPNGLRILSNSMLYAYGSMLFQGGQYLPEAQSGRFVLGFWWMFCLVVVATYSGNLIAFLAVTKDTLPFTNVEEMMQSGVKFGVQGSTSIERVLRFTKTFPYDKAWQSIQAFSKSDPDVLSSMDDVHVSRVLQGGYGYINDKTSFDAAMEKHCNLSIIKDEFLPQTYSIGLQEGSFYEKMISREVRKAKENGLLDKWHTKWWRRHSFCSRGLQTEAKAVTLADMQGAYYLLSIMFIASFCCLIGESLVTGIYKKFRKNKEI